MPDDPSPVTMVEAGDGVIVLCADADRAVAAAEELRRTGRRTAVFVGEPGPAADEFCAEVFGTPR